MIDELREILHGRYPRSDKLVALLFAANEPQALSDLGKLATTHGLRDLGRWNAQEIFKRARGLAIPIDGRWELTKSGRTRAEELGLSTRPSQVQGALTSLKQAAHSLNSADTRTFVEEAIGCLDAGWHRAAVIMSWVAAYHMLQQHVVKTALADFNLEAQKRFPKWDVAKTTDDLSRMGEADALDIMAKIGAVQKNVKAELKSCLDRRNACGHPNTYKLSEVTVAHHCDILLLNVFIPLG